MAKDAFRKHDRKKIDPARKAGQYIAVVPVGDTVLTEVCKSLYIGTIGDLVCILADDVATESTFVNASGWMPISVHTIKGTGDGTTCNDIMTVTED